MPRFVAFLRGINVGGRTVKKEKLQEIFVSLGFQNVATYKQSGNVIFEASTDDVEGLRRKIEDRLQAVLGYRAAVLLRSIEQLKSIVNQQPFKRQKMENSSFLVTSAAR